METLGLSGPPASRDNFLKRLFWPADNASDADTLGQQGFWVCLIVAFLSMVVLTIQGHWIIGLFTAFVFFLGGIGVREHSVVAAVAVATLYTVNLIDSFLMRQFPGFLSFLAAALLLGNVRGCLVASRWSRIDPESMPARLNDTWQDKLVDQLPAKTWPQLRIIFYIAACLYFALTVLGTLAVLLRVHRH